MGRASWNSRVRVAALLSAALALALLIWWARSADRPVAVEGVSATSASVLPQQAPAPQVPTAASAFASLSLKEAGASGDRAKRDQMRALIWKAFGQPAPAEEEPSRGRYVLPEHGARWTGWEELRTDAEPGIEPSYIQDSVRSQFFPVGKKCYEDALEKTPNLKGKVVLWFVIVGDAKVGGIVESVDVLNESTLRDPDVIECIRESFLGVTFPPPKGGGYITVQYPIVFSPDEEDAGRK